jgi:NitT/TauT family transport system ATP-binding protein
VSNEAHSHIVVSGVDVVYEAGSRRLQALSGIDLSVGRGEFVSIIGPSGCGKSTLLRVIGGLQAPTLGEVAIDGRPPREAQRAKEMGFVFQDPSLLPWRDVLDNVRLPLQVNRGNARRLLSTTSGTSESGRPETVRPELLEGRSSSVRPEPVEGRVGQPTSRVKDPQRMVNLVGLGEFGRYYPHQLSGGMQQRVALARSFVTAPSVLLMDEPFGALDEITRTAMRYELMRIWRSEAAERPCTVVFVTHSISEAVLLSDRVIVVTPRPGRIAADLQIDLPRPREEELEATPPFIEYMQTLRSLLREHALV